MRKCSFLPKLKKIDFKSKRMRHIAIAIAVVLLFPVRMSVLAPFEIQAKDPFVVTSPMEGVIKEIKVEPNQIIKKEQLLVQLDDIHARNSFKIATKQLDTAKAQLLTVQQGGFYDMQKKSEISKFSSEVKLREAELAYAKSMLEKTMIYSSQDGIAIVDNPNEWKGRPVSTGEKILSVANPNNVEIKIMVSVQDALYLDGHNDVKIFVDNRIFESWSAITASISYKPEATPQHVVSYKLIADFTDIDEDDTLPRIGLRGTAKVYASRVPFIFYLLRKPITYLRQMIAW
jgi:multidrug resistance efflux pump